MEDILRKIFGLLQHNSFIPRFVCKSWNKAAVIQKSSFLEVIEFNSKQNYLSLLKWLFVLYPKRFIVFKVAS